jgi:hypothetical protein
MAPKKNFLPRSRLRCQFGRDTIQFQRETKSVGVFYRGFERETGLVVGLRLWHFYTGLFLWARVRLLTYIVQ